MNRNKLSIRKHPSPFTEQITHPPINPHIEMEIALSEHAFDMQHVGPMYGFIG